jgi:polysaccharide biosynthesis transport protein
MANGIDLGFYAGVLKRRIAYFIIPALAVFGIGAGITVSLPKMYNSSAKILVESQQIPDAFVKSTVTALAAERLQVIQQRVLTRENILTLVDKFDLFQDNKNISKTEIVDLMRQRISFDNIDFSGAAKKGRNDNRLSVAFSLGFNSSSPALAAKIANELVTIVLEEDVRNRNNAASETTKFLTRESERVGVDISKIEATISDFKQKNSDMLPERLASNNALVDRDQRDIDELQRSVTAAQDQKRLLQLEASVKQSNGGQLTANSAASPLQQELDKLQLAYTQYAAVYSDSHPEMRSLKKQISSLQKQIEASKAALVNAKPVNLEDPNLGVEVRLIAEKISSLDNAIADAKARSITLSKAIEVLQKNIQATSGIGAELDSLERKRAALQASADDIEIKLGQARLGERLEQDQQAERFEVIESPVAPTEPISPKRVQLLFLALGAALASGVGGIFGAEFLDNTIRRESDITNKSHLGVLVTVPYIRTIDETRKSRKKIFRNLLLALVFIALSLLAVHRLVTPLDMLFYSARSSMKL